ncbi:MAG: S24 family peptidase, partial [Bacteroidota bacterium]
KSLGSNVLERILEIYKDINPIWLLTGKGEMMLEAVQNRSGVQTFRLKTDTTLDSQQIPLYDLEAVAGIVPLFSDAKNLKPVDHISIPQLPRCDGALYVTGDSMYPLLNSGDIIMYKIIEDITNGIFWGEMYLLGVNIGGEEYITVKYIRRSERKGHVILASENPHHQDKEVSLADIRAMALVKGSIRISAMM